MKKLLALILALILTLSFAACSNKENTEIKDDETVSDSSIVSDADENIEPDDETKDESITKPENENIKEENTQTNTQAKPEENKKPQETEKPQQPSKPQETTKPQPEAPKTVGNILLADFKAKASSSSALGIAEALAANEVFSPIGNLAAVSVEPGYLNGFDNAEIKGFKEGAMFAPMIGTHPIIGYVFTLEDGTDASSFIANLKSNANLRWNICTTADEMVAGSVGNKVFFVMCPTEFAEEE